MRGTRYKSPVGAAVASLWLQAFVVASSTSLLPPTTPSSATHTSEPYSFVDQTEQGIMARIGSMRSAVMALASAALVKGQASTAGSSAKADGLTSAVTTASASIGTATVNGTPTTYSVAFTVPADADVGPNLLPNIMNETAVQAQAVCPGYKASGVEKTVNGFTATLNLAGDPVSKYSDTCRLIRQLTARSATSTAPTSTP